MKSKTLKVLHPVCGRPLVYYPLQLAHEIKTEPILLVVGKNGGLVEKAIQPFGFKRMTFVVQDPPLGTAHAVMTAMEKLKRFKGDIIILNGDLPLMTVDTLRQFIDKHYSSEAALSFLTAVLREPDDYGRVLRDGYGDIMGVVEAKDASAVEKEIREINVGVYLVSSSFLRECLRDVKDGNRQKEFYLPDLIRMGVERNLGVVGLPMKNSEEGVGVNTQEELACANERRNKINLSRLMEEGVRVLSPQTVYVDTGIQVGRGSVIMGPAFLTGSTQVGNDCILEPAVFLKDSIVGNGVTLKANSYIEESRVDDGVQIGPMAHLRPGTHLKAGVKVGNFVEIKKSILHEGAKANHLSYLGDAEIGKRVNVGAGTITCNYDGEKKHKTIIEDDVFVGSDSQLVAPVKIGKGAYIGSGSTITKNVSPFSLALVRSPQVEIKGWAKKKKKKR